MALARILPMCGGGVSRYNPPMKVVQTGSMISDRGRSGKVETSGGGLSVSFESPQAGESLTPEHLFAGAYAGCFHSALRSAAERAHLPVKGSIVTADVRLEENDRGQYQLAVRLRASLPGVDRNDAERLLHQAHESCPYSKAVRGNVPVELELD
jgi:lipoyl-dependent peroxiredoxin